jgi:hypothetical protein
MLSLVWETERKKAAQAALEQNLKAVLERQGSLTIGFPGGSVDQTVYTAGEGALWVGFGGRIEAKVSRYWNAFGIYRPDLPAQSITVEINIAIDSDSAQVAGFFAEDGATGEIFLMHNGRVGGGRPGIGKSSFLVWSKVGLVDVIEKNGSIRNGITVGKLTIRTSRSASGRLSETCNPSRMRLSPEDSTRRSSSGR